MQKLGLGVAGGSGPGLASIDLVYLPFFASAGVLSDITARAHALPYLKQFDDAHMENATYKGRLYALPFSGDASVLFLQHRPVQGGRHRPAGAHVGRD